MRRALHLFATFVPGGTELRGVTLMNALGDRWEHRVAAMDDRLDALERVDPGIACQGLAGPGTKAARAVQRWVLDTIEREQPDVVLSYGWGAFDAVIAARRAGLPHHVHHEDGFNQDEAEGQLLRRRLARRWFLPRVPRLVVPSTGLADLARATWGVREERLRLIPNGVDVERFRPLDASARAEVRAELGIPEDARVVVTAAGYRRVKRLDRLIDAVQTIGDVGGPVHLVLAGDGPERDALAARAAAGSLGAGRVHLLGFRADLPRVHAAADVFCLSSDSEQQPVSLLEAMACGLPAVCTDVGDCAVTLGPLGDGALVDPREPPSALGAALRSLLSDPAACVRRGAAARERVLAEFTLDRMVAAHEATWTSVLRPGAGA